MLNFNTGIAKSKAKLPLLFFVLVCLNLSAQDYFLQPNYFRSFYHPINEKLILGNIETNLLVDIKTGEVDSLLPGCRLLPSKWDSLHLIFEKDWKKGIANWQGEIIIEPKYQKIYLSERLGGYTASLANKVDAISWDNYQPIEVGNDIEKLADRFVGNKIGINLMAKHGGSFVLNTQGDTLFNFLGKNQSFLREDFPDFLTVTNFDYKPGFKIINIDTGKEIINFTNLKLKSLKVGDYLRIELETKKKYIYLSPDGEVIPAGEPILRASRYGWSVYENCDPEQQEFQTLKKGDEVFKDCEKSFFYFLDDLPYLYFWHRNNAYSYLDKNGAVIIDGSDQKFCRHLKSNSNYFLRSPNGEDFEILNNDGSVLFKVKGDGYSFFSNFVSYTFLDKTYFSCLNDKIFQVFDENGKIVFEKPWFLYAAKPRLVNEFWLFNNEQGNYEIFNLIGEKINELSEIQIKWDNREITSPYLIYKNQEGWAVYDLKNSKEVLSGFLEIKRLNDRFLLVKPEERKYGLIDLYDRK